jgi:transcriptional regulator with XRE-family HTH domain
VGRTLKALREAKGLTYDGLAARVNLSMKKSIEAILRELGADMRVAWRLRETLLDRWEVDARTVERWEKVGFGVQRATRAAHEFYRNPAFVALIHVLDAEPDDMDQESRNAILQPGDTVERPLSDEGYATFSEDATGIVRFLALPDGYGGVFLKDERNVTDADHDTIKTYLTYEAAFLDAEHEELIDHVVQRATAGIDIDTEVRRLLDGEPPPDRT